jgi:hypothetical protein
VTKFRLVEVGYDEIREGDRVIVTPSRAPRFGLLVDAIYYEHYGKGRFAVAGYQVRVSEPHHRFTGRRVLRRRAAERAKLQKVIAE